MKTPYTASWLLTFVWSSTLATNMIEPNDLAKMQALQSQIHACIYRDSEHKPSDCKLEAIFSQPALSELEAYLAHDELFAIAAQYPVVMTEIQHASSIKALDPAQQQSQWLVQTPLTINITSGPVLLSYQVQSNITFNKKNDEYMITKFYVENLKEPVIINYLEHRQKNCQSGLDETSDIK
jgi:hypothetical protein